MQANILLQSNIFLIFILNGVIIGIVFDIFRILRKSFNTSDFVTCIEDILFWIISGNITLFLIFHINNGELRAYIFVALILGSILYTLFISNIFIKINMLLITIIKKTITIIFYPIKKIIKIFICLLKQFQVFLENILQKTSKHIKNISKAIKKLFKIYKKEGKTIEM